MQYVFIFFIFPPPLLMYCNGIKLETYLQFKINKYILKLLTKLANFRMLNKWNRFLSYLRPSWMGSDQKIYANFCYVPVDKRITIDVFRDRHLISNCKLTEQKTMYVYTFYKHVEIPTVNFIVLCCQRTIETCVRKSPFEPSQFDRFSNRWLARN